MLKKLEISGFKSFANKTTLNFPASIVAIVGPNGSGKSNVVEAMRFVLGEQSMKLLRGKSGADLIFKGGKNSLPLRRAKVAIYFDNKKRNFKLAENINLDFDEIIVAREAYQDGINTYSINSSEVRLKDIHELLASVGLGSSAHNIISQGEADRILSVPPPMTREMIEDALGLRVYQYRLKESERKLKKTEENLRETELLRREISPHLKFLKKQVEKIEEREKFKQDLKILAESYFGAESAYLLEEKEAIQKEKKGLEKELVFIEKTIVSKVEAASFPEDAKIKEETSILLEITQIKENLKQHLGRLEGMIEVKESTLTSEGSKITSVSLTELRKFLADLTGYLNWALENGRSLPEITGTLAKIREETKNFLIQFDTKKDRELLTEEINQIKQSKQKISAEINEIEAKESKHREKIRRLEEEHKTKEVLLREQEKKQFESLMKKREFESGLQIINLKEGTNSQNQNSLAEDIKEVKAVLGEVHFEKNTAPRSVQEDRRRQIERLKIKLEDLGGGAPEVFKEYEELSKREEFLIHEIEDLKKSTKDLLSVMDRTREQIEEEFMAGLKKISEKFLEFFSVIFGGGEAKLVAVKEEKKEDEEGEGKKGVEINIRLPHKKTRDLHALSGGERSLVSIALLFAMSAVNPPPFLVLDETDAALDEANSKKYGDMLERLAKSSQLVVVTHNRETMIRANILYGVMMTEGASRLLSVKIDEAVAIAK
ncbi:MAG TPA: AAA family ATPase [Candidatus Paceibacterota bacterium]|nr:AAA family ATPase [Candidatus Paceibacterota bacterium]